MRPQISAGAPSRRHPRTALEPVRPDARRPPPTGLSIQLRLKPRRAETHPRPFPSVYAPRPRAFRISSSRPPARPPPRRARRSGVRSRRRASAPAARHGPAAGGGCRSRRRRGSRSADAAAAASAPCSRMWLARGEHRPLGRVGLRRQRQVDRGLRERELALGHPDVLDRVRRPRSRRSAPAGRRCRCPRRRARPSAGR